MTNTTDNQWLSKTKATRKLILGFIILLYGFLLLLDNLGILPKLIRTIFFNWPIILIFLGIISLFPYHGSISGIILIATGIFFLLPSVINFPFNFIQLFWPLLLIIFGLLIILKRNANVHYHPYCHFHTRNNENKNYFGTAINVNNDYIVTTNIFSGEKRIVTSQQFKGGKITCIFGGSEIDFTQARLDDGIQVLDIACIFGGTSLIVPSEWEVRTEIVSILGGFADKRYNIPGIKDKNKTLIIKGITLFGGGEIKSYK